MPPQPGPAAIDRSGPNDDAYGTRALITPSDPAYAGICDRICGGVALLDVFDHYSGTHGFSETHQELQPV